MNLNISKNPFIVLTIIAILGILFGKFILSFYFTFCLATLFLILLLLNYFIFKIRRLSNFLLVISLFFAFILRFNSVYNYNKNHIALLDFSEITAIKGKIIECKYKSEKKNQYIISVYNAIIKNQQIPTNGKVLINTSKIDHRFTYGDLLKVKCKLQQPKASRNPGQFDYRKYLSSKDIYLTGYANHIDSIEVVANNTGNIFVHTIIEPIKKFVYESIESFVFLENGSILKALLLGEKQNIDDEVLDQFKKVGVVHVLAISGLHVGFFIIFIFTFLSFFRLNYKSKTFILLILLFTYVAIIGFKAPVVRASMMAGLYLIAKISERKIPMFNIIFFVGFLLLLIDPRELFNPGFQFSFVAVLSIVYGYPKLNSLFFLKSFLMPKIKKSKFLRYIFNFIWDPLLVSLAAVLGTLPLTLYYYGIFPTYALFANILVIPLVGLVVFLGIFLILFSIFSNVLASNLGNLIDFFFELLKSIISIFNDWPYSHFYATTPSITVILLMLVLVFSLFNIKSKYYRIISIGILTLIILFNTIENKDSKYLNVTFLDVSQGDASFIEFPNGETILIDGGDDSYNWDQGKNTIIPFLKYNNIKRLRYVVASHPHNDHIGGLTEILETLNVDTVIMSGYKFNSKKYKNMIDVCEIGNIPIRIVGKGDLLYPDSSCRVYILHPTEKFIESNDFSGKECNNSSIVMKVQYGENGVLFTGDAEKEAEEAYTQYGDFLECEIIKMGHHGSKTSSTFKLLNFVNPLVGIVSVAEKNKFKHPSPVTMDKFIFKNIKPFLTSKHGAIKFSINQHEIKLVHWNKNSLKLF